MCAFEPDPPPPKDSVPRHHRRGAVQSSAMLTPQASSAALINTGAFVLLFGTDLTLRYWNRACAASVDVPWEAVSQRRPATHLFDLEDGERFEAALEAIQQGDDAQTLETAWPRSGGAVERVAWSLSLLSDDRETRRLVATGLDVSKRHRAQQALHRSEARYRAVMWQTTDVICLLDGDTGAIVEANPAMHRLLDYPEGELIGRRIHDVLAHRPESVEQNLTTILQEGGRWLGERNYLDRHGRKVPAEVQVDTLDLEGQHLLCVVARDLRPRKAQEAALRRQEEALRQAQRLESVGQLAAGIAHDFNNLLTTIIGFADLLTDSFDVEDQRQEDVEAIIDAGERGSSLVRQLLAFSRQQVLQPRRLALNETVEEMLPLLRRLIGEDVSLETALNHRLPPIHADPGQMSQVLMNLAVNARDAMPAGGRLRIETAAVAFCEADLSAHPDVSPGLFVRLRVADSGTGMDPAVRERIFEPFFTTKPDLKGTGMGLATVYGIVNQHDGFIAVQSSTGAGAQFDILLPALEGPFDVKVASDRRVARPQGAGRTLLVVEDEAAVLRYATRTLEAAGFQVHAMESAEDALERATQLGDDLAALFSDVVLPGMNGVELAERLRTAHPALPILLTSGHVGDRSRRDRIAERGYAFLPKPYDTRTLLAELDRIL